LIESIRINVIIQVIQIISIHQISPNERRTLVQISRSVIIRIRERR